MQENDILDDLDIQNETISTGTPTQLWRGFILGVIIQFITWATLFKVMDIQNWDKSIYEIDWIGYRLSIMVMLLFVTITIGSGSFMFFANGKHQAFHKIIPLSLLFSICSFVGVSIWRGFTDGETWYWLLVHFPYVSIAMMFLQFVMTCGLLMLVKKKWRPVGLLLLVLVFLGLGFIR